MCVAICFCQANLFRKDTSIQSMFRPQWFHSNVKIRLLFPFGISWNISLITFSCAESCYLYVNEISLNFHRITEHWVRRHPFVVWCNPIWSDLMQHILKMAKFESKLKCSSWTGGQVTNVDILSGGPPPQTCCQNVDWIFDKDKLVPLRSRLKKYFPEFSIWECDCW